MTVISPAVLSELASLADTVIKREYESADCPQYTLIFACTNKREVNARITADGVRAGIPVNVADAPEECGFLVPARFHSGDVQVAV